MDRRQVKTLKIMNYFELNNNCPACSFAVQGPILPPADLSVVYEQRPAYISCRVWMTTCLHLVCSMNDDLPTSQLGGGVRQAQTFSSYRALRDCHRVLGIQSTPGLRHSGHRPQDLEQLYANNEIGSLSEPFSALTQVAPVWRGNRLVSWALPALCSEDYMAFSGRLNFGAMQIITW